MQPGYQQKTQDQRLAKLRKSEKRIKLLITIIVLLLILFSIILYASFRKGGIANLIKGNDSVVNNTIKNIGTSFVEDKEKDAANMKYITPIGLPTPTDPVKDREISHQGFITFSNLINEYNTTIKKGSFVYFMNETSMRMGFLFSDGRDMRLNANEEQNFYFDKKGDYTFVDQLDSTQNQIHGTIHVTD